MSAQTRLVRLAGHRVTVNGCPAEIVNNTVRWNRAMGTHFEFAEDHGGQWSEDGLTWRIDGKTIRFYETSQHSTAVSKPAPACAQWRVTASATAWASIGHGGPFRIKGGCAVYDTVIHNCATFRTDRVLLTRLGNYVGHSPVGLRQYNRWVGPDTVLEFLEPVIPPKAAWT